MIKITKVVDSSYNYDIVTNWIITLVLAIKQHTY